MSANASSVPSVGPGAVVVTVAGVTTNAPAPVPQQNATVQKQTPSLIGRTTTDSNLPPLDMPPARAGQTSRLAVDASRIRSGSTFSRATNGIEMGFLSSRAGDSANPATFSAGPSLLHQTVRSRARANSVSTHGTAATADNSLSRRPRVPASGGLVNLGPDPSTQPMTGFPLRRIPSVRRVVASSGDGGAPGIGPDALLPGMSTAGQGVRDRADRTQAEEAATPTVQAHVERRAERRKRERRFKDRAFEVVLTSLLNWHVILSLLAALTGLILYTQYPEAKFWENAAYRWLFLFAAMSAVILPLRMWEWAFWWILQEVVLAAMPFLREPIDFAHAAQGHLADIGTIIMALLLYSVAFQLSFGATGEVIFQRICISLIVIKVGLILKNVALKLAIYRLYRKKHSKAVADVIFYEEVSRNLSAPLPSSLAYGDPEAWARAWQGYGEEDGIRRTLTPTQLLDLETFWAQASYVRNNTFTIYDEIGDCVMVESEETVVEYAGLAFDRLSAAKVAREEAQLKLENAVRARLGGVGQSFLLQTNGHGSSHLDAPAPFGSLGRNTHAAFPAPALIAASRVIKDVFTASSHGMEAGTGAGAQISRRASASELHTPTDSRVDGPTVVGPPPPIHAHPPPIGATVVQGGGGSQGEEGVEEVTEDYPSSPDMTTAAMDADKLAAIRAAVLSREDLAPCFPDPSDLDAVIKLMDLDGSGAISRDEMVSTFTLFLAGWGSTRKALESYAGISDALKMIAEAVCWIILFFVVLAIFDVNFQNVLVPLGTVMVSLSFALGPSISSTVSALLFILVQAPYDVGDRVQCRIVGDNTTAVVSQINVLTTVFCTTSDNKLHMVRNADLALCEIINHRRSPQALFSPKFTVDHTIVGAQLGQLQAGVEQWLREHQVAWLPTCSVTVSPVTTPPNSVEVAFWCTQHASWQEGGKIWPAYTQLCMAIVALLRSMDLKYVHATRPVEIRGMEGPGGSSGPGGGAQGGGRGGSTALLLTSVRLDGGKLRRPSGFKTQGQGQGGRRKSGGSASKAAPLLESVEEVADQSSYEGQQHSSSSSGSESDGEDAGGGRRPLLGRDKGRSSSLGGGVGKGGGAGQGGELRKRSSASSAHRSEGSPPAGVRFSRSASAPTAFTHAPALPAAPLPPPHPHPQASKGAGPAPLLDVTAQPQVSLPYGGHGMGALLPTVLEASTPSAERAVSEDGGAGGGGGEEEGEEGEGEGKAAVRRAGLGGGRPPAAPSILSRPPVSALPPMMPSSSGMGMGGPAVAVSGKTARKRPAFGGGSPGSATAPTGDADG